MQVTREATEGAWRHGPAGAARGSHAAAIDTPTDAYTPEAEDAKEAPGPEADATRLGPSRTETDAADPVAGHDRARGTDRLAAIRTDPGAGRAVPREPPAMGRARPGRDARTGGGMMTTRIYIAGPIMGYPR